MKRFLLLLLCSGILLPTGAQVRDLKKEYEAFKKQANRSYSGFRDEVNAEYARFIKQAWQKFNAEPALPTPQPDPPLQPVYVQPERPLPSRPLSCDIVVKPRPETIQPQPFVPVPEPAVPLPGTISFRFFGAECSVHAEAGNRVKTTDDSEEAVSRAWTQFSGERFNALLADCLHLREKLQLGDWAYFCLARQVSALCYETDDTPEAVVMQAYILTQSGYRVRLARTEGKLYLLLPFDTVVYARSYTNIGGIRYYFTEADFRGGSFEVCDFAFPGEQNFSLYMNRQPLFPLEETACRVFTAARYPATRMALCTNRNLTDFYNTYPHCPWEVYVSASLSKNTKEKLYPILKECIRGKSEAEAAGILIDFVQTAFEYRTDEEQFGYERPLFPDETLYYPYSDCEDRAIFYSVLVRELLGLKVALLHYPHHLAVAVRFNEETEGDYIEIGGQKYIVCDPTFSGAGIGRTMPEMNNQTAKIIEL